MIYDLINRPWQWRDWFRRRTFVHFAEFWRATIFFDRIRDPELPVPYWPVEDD